MHETKDGSIEGIKITPGSASGRLLFSNTELSFWGGVDPTTGEIIDRHHPLSGQYLHDVVLAIPGARGSCSGSAVMMELMYAKRAPKALVFERLEDVITLGVIIAEEFWDISVPVIRLATPDFEKLQTWNGQQIFVKDGMLSRSLSSVQRRPTTHPHPTKVQLAAEDREQLSGSHGEAASRALRIIIRYAALVSASELLSVKQAHIDACQYVGPGGLSVIKQLRDWGGQCAVPTSINSISIDRQRWRALGVSEDIGTVSTEIANAFIDMGARPTFTCAPYQLSSSPILGEQVGWSESNAVVYANSVLGARTMKYPDFLDVAIALTGRAPKAGVHIDANRLATVEIRIPPQVDADDSFWPLLGECIGSIALDRIPILTGLRIRPDKDDLKAFGAAFATTSSAPMFHILGVTPEATSMEIVTNEPIPYVMFDLNVLRTCWRAFNKTHGKVDLISLGNPHLSLAELRRIAELCRGKQKHCSTSVMITCGRNTYSLAVQAGIAEEIERFGIDILSDTCWCMITDPVIKPHTRVIMTNSGKYAHYGPGLTGRDFCFGSLGQCISAACSGSYDCQEPDWMANIPNPL